jgi:glycosyltransferase involved in cell wall biosynthesis
MRLVLHDYSGHPFQVQLSRELARRGHEVRHLHCTSYRTGKGAVAVKDDDPAGFSVETIDLGEEFDRYRYVRRVRQERRYARLFREQVDLDGVDAMLCCNVPLLALDRVQRTVAAAGVPFVFWQQDVYSLAMADAAEARLPVVGGAVGRRFVRIEQRILRNSAAVVTISADFEPLLTDWGVPAEHLHTIENWAPLEDLPPRLRDNAWARAHDLGATPVVLYAGTLGLKHDPSLLLELARRLGEEAEVVVVSEGQGADWLRDHAQELRVTNLRILPFQPFEALPDVLGSSDVLVALLEPDAGAFSVPSKVLSYHCAGRPVLAAVPGANLAARIVQRAGSGVVVEPGDSQALADEGLALVRDPARRTRMGEAARTYAEATFGIGRIGDRFERILVEVTGPGGPGGEPVLGGPGEVETT